MTPTPFVPWPAGETLVLASRSPRRAELLRTAGIPFEIIPAGDVEAEHAAGLADLHHRPGLYAEELDREMLHRMAGFQGNNENSRAQ